MLAVWFNESLLKKIGTPGAIFQFFNFWTLSSCLHTSMIILQSFMIHFHRTSHCMHPCSERVLAGSVIFLQCLAHCFAWLILQHSYLRMLRHDHHITPQGCDTQMYLVHSQICRPKHVPPPSMKLLQQISPQFPKKTEEFCIAFLLFCFIHYFIHQNICQLSGAIVLCNKEYLLRKDKK